jgi:5'-nucleotidase
MKILLTNDDGIQSPGLQLLKQALGRKHEVWVVAPESNRSASSHAITLREPTRIQEHAKREYICGGTPADCVLIGLLGLLPGDIDLVISGVNLGPNLGTDIIYSGTAAGARQGALMGKPALACSLNAYTPPFNLEIPVAYITEKAEALKRLWNGDHFLNINFPGDVAADAAVEITYPIQRIYEDELVRFKAPNGHLYCFIDGSLPRAEMEAGSDFLAVEEGRISISPVLIHPTNHEIEQHYRQALCCDSRREGSREK